MKLFITLFLLFASVLVAKDLVIFRDSAVKVTSLSAIDSSKVDPLTGTLFLLGRPTDSMFTNTIDSIKFYDASLTLSASALFNAAAAYPVILKSNNALVTMDLRNRTTADSSVIVTDPIDLLDTANTGLTINVKPTSYNIMVTSTTPVGASITIYYSTGDSIFSSGAWSTWSPLGFPSSKITSPSGRYLKLQIIMKAASKTSLPAISSIFIGGNYPASVSTPNSLQISSFKNERIISGAFGFGWEAKGNATIQALISRNRLDTVGINKPTAFDRVIALNDWVARRPQHAPYTWNPYPWSLDSVLKQKDSIQGHCMSYSEVLISTLTGLGYFARHWAMEGLDNNNNHEVVEWWCDSLHKWIYFDPSLDTYFKSNPGGVPLSMYELHNIYLTVLHKTHVTSLLTHVDSKYHYGVLTASYDWNNKQGYTTTGQLKLTERNNFHSQPAPVYDGFGQGFNQYNDINLFHNWSDSLTNPYDSLTPGALTTCFDGRYRDFWYTINQASIKAKRTGTTSVEIEFGNSQPRFSTYLVSIDGAAETQMDNSYPWTLHSGLNTIKVTPKNLDGVLGIPSTLSITN